MTLFHLDHMATGYFVVSLLSQSVVIEIASRELTYPRWGQQKSSTQKSLQKRIMLVSSRATTELVPACP